jgi:hypothetical protein
MDAVYRMDRKCLSGRRLESRIAGRGIDNLGQPERSVESDRLIIVETPDGDLIEFHLF